MGHCGIHNLIIQLIISSLIGGGIGYTFVRLFMQHEAKEALKEDLKTLWKKVGDIEEDYVTCKYCDMQHKNIENTLQNMNHKLDILIERG